MQSIRKEAKSRSQLRNLILLLLRVLAIIFLVLAFAQPVKVKVNQPIIKGRHIVALYVDNSFSMDAEGKFGILLEQAKVKAHEIVTSCDINTQYLLTTNNFELKHQQLVDKDQVIDWIGEISPTHIIRTINEVKNRQFQILKKIDTTALVNQYFLSDFQKIIFDPSDYQFSAHSNIVFVPLINENQQNVYIDSVWFSTPGHFLNKEEVLNVKVVNASDNEIGEFRVNLFINDSLKSLSTITLEAGKTTTVPLSFIQNKIGENIARVEITDYPITFDNTLHFSYFICENIKIACINGKESGTYFQALFENDANFDFKNYSYSEINYEEINQQQLVVLNELDEISSGLALTLKDFVNAGNRLLIIPSASEIEKCNNLLQQLACPILINWRKETGNTKPIKLKQLYFKNAIKELSENSLMPEYKGFYTIKMDNSSLTETIIETESGQPLVIQNKVNQGDVILFTIPLTKENNMAVHPVFVPLVYNIGLYSSQLEQLYYTIKPGLFAQTKSKQNSGVFRLAANDNAPEMVPVTQYSNGILKVFVDENELTAGTYHLYQNNEFISLFSFNYNRQESNLQCYSVDELMTYAQNAPDKNIEILNSQKLSITHELEEAKSGKPISYIFIVLALLMLLGEFSLLKVWH